MLLKNGEKWDNWAEALGYDKVDLKKDALFILSDHYKGVKHNERGKSFVTYPPLISIEPVVMIEHAGSIVEVRYVERMRPESTKNKAGLEVKSRYTPDSIQFVNGVYRVPAKNKELYFILLNQERCESNPRYKTESGKAGRTKTPIFYLKDEEAEQLPAFNKEMLLADAYATIKGMNDRKARTAYAAFGLTDGKTLTKQGISAKLFAMAKSDPKKFMDTINNADAIYIANVLEAISYGVIKFNKKMNFWQWTGENTGAFLSVPKGENPERVLANELRLKPSGEVATNITNLLALKSKELEEAESGK